MELVISIILFYLITPGILINIKGNKYIIAIVHTILFTILFSLFTNIIGSKTKEKLSNPNTTACPGNAVHSNWGQGKDCIQCPSINKVQLGAFPHLVTTDKGTWGFDGFCGFANNYDSNGNVNTVHYTQECPINEITNKKKLKDTPVFVPSFDQDLRFCLSEPLYTRDMTYTGFDNFNIVTNNKSLPFYVVSGNPKDVVPRRY
jgi:hypothetical protein